MPVPYPGFWVAACKQKVFILTKHCLAHDSNPMAPSVFLPKGSCDCHAHVIAPPDVQSYVENRSYTPPPASLDAYKNLHAVLGIDRAVIVQPSIYGTDNNVTLQSIRDYGPECRGIAVVDEAISDSDLEALHHGGIRGIRYNLLFGGGVDISSLERMADRIASFGWHIQVLLDGPGLADLEPRLQKISVQTVVDHMGHVQTRQGLAQPGFQALLRLVENGRTWVKLSGNYRMSKEKPDFADAIPFAKALINAAPDRMVWGTDWPHPALFDYMPKDHDLVHALYSYFDDPGLARSVLVDNPAELYGFER